MNNNSHDAVFNQLLETISQIEIENPDHSALISVLKMARSIGSYLKSNKGKAHPDALTVLSGLGKNIEKLIPATDLNKQQITAIFQDSFSSFKTLKQKIMAKPVVNKTDLEELRSVILAIDWEITDTTLRQFETVVNEKLLKLKPNSIFHLYLKIIQSTGGYIGTKKADAHTDSISFLRSVFGNFDKVVQSDDFDLKKRLLEKDIKRFKAFRQKISEQPPNRETAQPASDESTIPPALSHVKSNSGDSSDQNFELTELPEEQETLDGSGFDQLEELPPALSDKAPAFSPGMDVMDDLFSVKETPADELLDAIHLMNVHGDNDDQALKMLDQQDERGDDGIQNFTPRRKDTDPIPEIGTRLDEFFNLEEPGTDDTPPLLSEQDDTADAETDEASSEAEIIPFDYKDESFESLDLTDETDEADDTNHLPEQGEPPVPAAASESGSLKPLLSFLSESGWEKDRFSLQSIQKECFNLKERWPDDPEKEGLLDIIISLSRTLEEIFVENPLEQPLEDNEIKKDKPKGFFSKIKGMFSS